VFETENSNGNISVETNPNPEGEGMAHFTKYSDVFGLGIYAESSITDEQVIHAASIFAELLDNDEDGVVDDEALLSRLQEMEAMMPMFNYEGSPAFDDFVSNYDGHGVSAVLFADEVDPDLPGHWGDDASVEEIMHTINHVGHVNVYPAAFGLEPDSSLLSDAMDVARGGQFKCSRIDIYVPDMIDCMHYLLHTRIISPVTWKVWVDLICEKYCTDSMPVIV
jgi:hypothetical protein